MIKTIKYLKHLHASKSSFVANLLTLMTGTTIAQAIPIAISPILTRIYTPNDFGVVALYVSISSIIAVIATGRFELAQMLPEKDEDAVNLAALSIISAFFVSFMTLLIVWFFNDSITNLLGNTKISNWLYFIPFTIFLVGIGQTLNYWSNRKNKYKRIAISKVSASTAVAGTNLGMGFSGFGASGLIMGNIVGQSIGMGILGLQVWREDRNIKNHITSEKTKKLFIEYLDYPKKSAVGAFFNAVSYQIEFILFSMFYNLVSLGHYYFVNRIVSIPKSFLSGAIWQVFLGENRGKTKEQIFKSLNHYQQKIFRITTLPFYSSLFIVSNLFVIIFGENWGEATKFLYPLIIASHVNLIVASFSLFTIINRPDAEMLFNVLLAVLKVSAIVLTYLIFKNILYSVITIAIVQFIMFFLLGSWNYKQLGKSSRYFAILYLKQVINIVPYLIILFVISYLVDNLLVLLASVVALNFFHIKSSKI